MSPTPAFRWACIYHFRIFFLYNRFNSVVVHLFEPQVVDQHVAAEAEPQVAEPDHLALVRRGHGLPGGAQLGLGAKQVVGVDEALGVLGVGVAREERRGNGGEEVQAARVLAQQADGAQRVDVDGALPLGLALGQGLGEAARAVVEADVVGVGRHAAAVKGDEGVDVGCGLVGVFGSLARQLRRKGLGQQVGDLGLVPMGRHGVGEVLAAS